MVGIKEFGMLLLLLIIFTASSALPTVPMLINYQGQLTDLSGESVVDGDYSMRFSLFDTETGGSRLWNVSIGEEQLVTVTNGVYSVQLGAVDSLETSVFNVPEVWMEVAIYNADTTLWEALSPRQLLTSNAYAIKAGDADTLQGLSADTFITLESDPTVEPFIKDGISWDELSGIPTDIADGDNDSGGDITAVVAETGLVGGGFTGDIPLAVDFAGSGVDPTAAHSDHHHEGIYSPDIHSHDASNVSSGMLALDRFSAIDDLMVEGYLDNDSGTDLLLKDQADATYWRLGGNLGQYPNLFFGTLEPEPLEFRVHNQHALRLEPGTTPNLIGGFAGNFTTDGVVGATISGGGEDVHTNRVTDDFGTVGGGADNQAGNGDNDNFTSQYATVSGGEANTASEFYATVGGGILNTASAYSATVAGGADNTANAADATVSGGIGNNANERFATVCGGSQNTASSENATVAGGRENTAGERYATVGGGWGNSAEAIITTIPGGFSAKADNYGQMAYASGPFANTGDAQTSVYVLRNTTYDWDVGELFLDGGFADKRLTVDEGRTMTFNILVVGRGNSGISVGYRIQGVIENYEGIVTMVNSSVEALGEDWHNFYASALARNNALTIEIRGGKSGETIRWVTRVETAEVAW